MGSAHAPSGVCHGRQPPGFTCDAGLQKIVRRARLTRLRTKSVATSILQFAAHGSFLVAVKVDASQLESETLALKLAATMRSNTLRKALVRLTATFLAAATIVLVSVWLVGSKLVAPANHEVSRPSGFDASRVSIPGPGHQIAGWWTSKSSMMPRQTRRLFG